MTKFYCWDDPSNVNVCLNKNEVDFIQKISSKNNRIVDQISYDDTNSDKNQEHLSQVYTWLSQMNQLSIKNTDESLNFNSHLGNLEEKTKDIDSYISKTIELINSVKDEYNSVSEKTSSIDALSQKIKNTQKAMHEKTLKIEEILQHYENINFSQQILTNPKEVNNDSFRTTIEKFYKSYYFIQNHPKFKDYSEYMTLIGKIESQTMSLISDTIKRTLSVLFNEVAMIDTTVDAEKSFLLLYGRFHMKGQAIRNLYDYFYFEDKQTRVQATISQQTIHFYIYRREEVISGICSSAVGHMIQKNRDKCSLLKAVLAFLVHIYEDESRLFHKFFGKQSEDVLNKYLYSICNSIYDELLPALLEVNYFEVLTEMITIILNEIKTDRSDEIVCYKQYEEMVNVILKDLKERLLVRADVYMTDQILKYHLNDGDLAYPDSLLMAWRITCSDLLKGEEDQKNISVLYSAILKTLSESNSSQSLSSNDEKNVSRSLLQHSSLSPSDIQGMWYPTVRRSIIFLIKCFQCFDRETFRQMAQQCISKCIQSLILASDYLQKKKPMIDCKLFMIKHLLILREHVSVFNLELITTETKIDFSNIRETAMKLMKTEKSDLLTKSSSNLLFKLLTEAPNVTSVVNDGRRELDYHLKMASNDLINWIVEELTLNLDEQKNSTGTLDELRDNVSKSYRLLKIKNTDEFSKENSLSMIKFKMLIYLGNVDTVWIILKQIEKGVIERWKKFEKLLKTRDLSENDVMSLGMISDYQIRLLFLKKEL